MLLGYVLIYTVARGSISLSKQPELAIQRLMNYNLLSAGFGILCMVFSFASGGTENIGVSLSHLSIGLTTLDVIPPSIRSFSVEPNLFAIGNKPTIADFSMMAYLSYPADETGYDFAISHPAIHAWLGRIATLPGWHSPYDLLPGKRLVRYV